MTSPSTPPSLGGVATVLGGLIIVALGVLGVIDANGIGAAWMIAAALAVALIVGGLVALRVRVADLRVARWALVPTIGAFALFGLAHLYALVDEDTAILLFSVFMVLGAIGLVVAGVPLWRRGQGWARTVPLVCGVWPLLTVPAGAALGDVPHFGAIAVWGLTWVALGIALQGGISARTGVGTAPTARPATAGF